MATIFYGLLVGLWLILSPGLARGNEVASAVETVAEKMIRSGELTGKRIAVGMFGPTDELGAHLADQLELVLMQRAGSSGFEVINRNQICQVIRENKLWLDGQFDPALPKKLGRLAQVDLLAEGHILDIGSRLSVKMRLVESETNRSIWEDSASVVSDDRSRLLLSRRVAGDGCEEASRQASDLILAPAPPGALQVKIWADKASYRIGQPVHIGVRVNRDAYVTLVNIGTSGEVVVIYPNRFSPRHFVRAGQDVLIPPRGSGIVPVIHGPEEFDQIRAIGSDEPYTFLPGDVAGPKRVFRSLDPIEVRGLMVEIKKGRGRVPPARWAEDVIAVRVTR